MATTTPHRPLTQLTHEIEQLEAEVARLEAERCGIARDNRKAARHQRYLRIAQSLRRPTAQFDLWPIAVMIIGPLVVGFFTLVIVNLLVSSFAIAFLALLGGAAAGAVLFASLLCRPADSVLPAALAEAQSQLRLAEARLKEKVERITETKTRLQKLVDERRDQIASGKLQKAALLQRHWKKMGDAEWEDYVVEVCRTLGAKVDRIGRPGGEDANLIADFSPRRVAILTQGEGHNVSSDTVRQALAAKQRHQCDGCAVIINRRFTGAAQHFAQLQKCGAIGAGEFPDFVMGKVAL